MSDRAGTFDALYRERPDPWNFETSDYEHRKYAATLAALPAGPTGAVLEVGCSIGVFTRSLAERFSELTAVDVSAVALEAARRRCEGLDVRFVQADIPREWPAGLYGVIVLSELLYFLEPEEIPALARRVAGSIAPGGTVLLVDYLGPCDRPLDGAAAADAFIAASGPLGLSLAWQGGDVGYRIDRLLAPPAERSAAARGS